MSFNNNFNDSGSSTVVYQIATGPAIQVNKIDGTVISLAQWAYLGGMNQALTTTSSPTFTKVTAGQIDMGSAISIGNTSVATTYDVTIGESSGSTGTLGYNVAIGFNAMDTPAGDHNVALGTYAGSALTRTGATDAKRNLLLGYHTGIIMSTASYNTCIGSDAGAAITTGGYNVFVGFEADGAATTNNQIAIGRATKSYGQYAVAIGADCNACGFDVSLGYEAGSSDTLGRNVAIGAETGTSASGAGNVSIGSFAGNNLARTGASDAQYNTFIGYGAGETATTAVGNIAIGYNSAVGGALNYQVAMGYAATANGADAIAIGRNAYSKAGLISIGYGAGSSAVRDDSHNICIGTNSGNTMGDYAGAFYNVLIGTNAGTALTSGGYTVCMGYNAGLAISTGSTNACLGYQAGNSITTGSYNTCVGPDSDAVAASNNQTAIGYQAITDTADQVYLGNGSVGSFKCQVALTVVSDIRHKSSITPLDVGLDFVNKLNPVSYTLKDDKSQKQRFGLIAQEVNEVDPRFVDTENPDRYGLCYESFIAPMLKSIQQLSSKVEALEALLAKKG